MVRVKVNSAHFTQSKFFTFVWSSSEYDLEKYVPLTILSDAIERNGAYNSHLTIVFLEGIEFLSEGYLQRIANNHVSVINYQVEYRKIKNKYAALLNSYSEFYTNCFLRWICFKEIAKNNDYGQVWAIDTDVLPHASLDVIALNTKNKTFLLEGCPTLTSISNYEWFDIYEKQLEDFISDIKGYSINAQINKNTNKKDDDIYCNRSYYQNPLRHDQDLLEYLISAKILPQEQSSSIFSNDLYYIQNPLEINNWEHYQGRIKNNSFKSRGKDIIVNDSRFLVFTHFQTSFVTFCNLYYILVKMKMPLFAMKRIMKFKIVDEKLKMSWLIYSMKVVINRLKIALKRNQIIAEFRKEDNKLLVEALNLLASIQ
jgi:hypothetical protein